MKIKKRVFGAPVVEQPVAQSAFPLIEAKPKEPLPEAVYDIAPRRLGPVALGCGSAQADQNFNAGDYVRNLRTPYDPKSVTEVRYRNRVRNRATGIVAKCVDCAGSRKNVTECAAIECPLWAFRLGGNPFRRRK